MKRRTDSHKGDNGKVAVIGGSTHMHGAPLFAALAAEASGVDLVYVCLPHCHAEVAKVTSLNFIVHSFSENELTSTDVASVLELLATMDCAVIGPGIAKEASVISVLNDVLAEAACTLVLDATALQTNTLDLVRSKNAILTPHLGELERMGLSQKDLSQAAKKYEATIVLKGMVDVVTKQDGSQEKIAGGNAGLTVGGTGDVLAGLIAGLVAQEHAHDAACEQACRILKASATGLYEKYGPAFTAQQVIQQIPSLVHTHD